jgi:putative membrane protein
LNTTDESVWRHTSPLAIIFYIGRIISQIAQNAVQTLAPLVALSFAYQGDLVGKIAFAAIAFAIFILAASVLRWLFFRYQVAGNSVLIREGVFEKRQLDIKFDRIQAINTEQNVIFRAFNLVTVKFDTAGSAGQEGHLPAIKLQLANEIREKIRRRKSATAIAAEESEEPDEPKRHELMSLNNADMIRIGLSDNRALIILAFFGPLLNQAEEKFGSMVDKDTVFAALATELGVAQGASAIFLLVVIILLALALMSVIGAFLRFYRYSLIENEDIYQSTGGLLTRHVHSINRNKIQTLMATQNIMLRMFGRYRIYARQASSARKQERKSFAIPICLPQQLEQLGRKFYGGEFDGLAMDPRSDAFHPIAFQYVRSRLLLTAVLPAGLATLALAPALGWYALILLFWIPPLSLTIWQRYRRFGVQVSGDGIALRNGFLGYRVTSFLHRKVQRIGITQTFFQRRKGLATMRFFLASGTIKVPYVDHRKAVTLRDFVLYRVESSQLAWH